MKTKFLCGLAVATALSLLGAKEASSQVKLIAKGTLTEPSAGLFQDLSGLDYNLENGAPANLLGGLGSGLAWGFGDTFLAVPDRGPNAVSFDSLVDDTVSYVPRFHTIKMNLQPSSGPLPFTLTTTLEATTLLFSHSPLVYGSGSGLGVGPGASVINTPRGAAFLADRKTLTRTELQGMPATRGWIAKQSACRATGSESTFRMNMDRTLMNLTARADSGFGYSNCRSICLCQRSVRRER